MFSLELLLATSVVMLVIGAVIGIVIGRSWVPPEQQKALENRLNSAKQELDTYQQDVAKHFVETSRYVAELTQNYRELHAHLAKGALQLANTEVGRQMLSAGEKESNVGDLGLTPVEPPKDWAPPKGGYGMLSEQYGLTEMDDNPDEAVAHHIPPKKPKA